MDYELIRKDLSFQEQKRYTPLDTQYIRYADSNPGVVSAGHKIDDVYYCFSNARCSFMNAGASNFGDLAADTELSKKYTKAHFLIQAVLEYSICTVHKQPELTDIIQGQQIQENVRTLAWRFSPDPNNS